MIRGVERHAHPNPRSVVLVDVHAQERLNYPAACSCMKQFFGLAAVLCLLALGGSYMASQGHVDRDVPGRTTEAGKNKLGD